MSNTERPSTFKTILVAYDGSPSADAAFKAALDLAKTYATSLTIRIVGAFNRSRVRALNGMRELGYGAYVFDLIETTEVTENVLEWIARFCAVVYEWGAAVGMKNCCSSDPSSLAL